MTYYALENRLRKWKKEAAALKAEVDGVPPPAKSPTKSKAKKGGVSPSKDGQYLTSTWTSHHFGLCVLDTC
jgi:hypothetical protein